MIIPTIRTRVKSFLKPKSSKRLRLRQLPFAGALGIAVVFISGSALAANAIMARNDAEAVQKASELAKSEHANLQTEAAKQTQVAQKSDDAKSSQSPASPATQNPASATQPTITKWKTDPDPRSTAYSLTPPAPNPKSFDITITHNGQIAPGTEISYNATKDAKTYYAGDFVFSVPSVTIRKSQGLYSSWFTVSTPDGKTANEPVLPWYETNANYWPNSSGSDGPGTSWTMAIDISNALTPGTYQVHFTSFRTNEGADAWEYDGFITLDVES